MCFTRSPCCFRHPATCLQQWTQCENANCGKWRKLPPGSIVDEDAPWYCYMNSDPRRARCSASEEVRVQGQPMLQGGRRGRVGMGGGLGAAQGVCARAESPGDAGECSSPPTCSAHRLQSYDEKTEIVLPDGGVDDEEALHNQLIKRHLEASMAASVAMGVGPASRGRGRGRG